MFSTDAHSVAQLFGRAVKGARNNFDSFKYLRDSFGLGAIIV